MGNELPPDGKPCIDEEADQDSIRAKIVAEMLSKESDRGCVIFGAAILHDDLEALFRAFCRKDASSLKLVIDPLFKGYAPLATFSARIHLAYALRLIPKGLYRKLELIRRLRNEFAHEAGPIDLQDPRCTDRLRLLVADGATRKTSEDDDVESVFDRQILTKRQMIDRLAFVIAISRLSARTCFIAEQIEDGADVHAIVAALEEDGR